MLDPDVAKLHEMTATFSWAFVFVGNWRWKTKNNHQQTPTKVTIMLCSCFRSTIDLGHDLTIAKRSLLSLPQRNVSTNAAFDASFMGAGVPLNTK